MSPSVQNRKALIIGGGPVGLSAAYVLKKQCGLDIEVFEAASELVKTGAGIHIGNNGTRVLFKAGLTDIQQRSQACRAHDMQFLDKDGKLLTEASPDKSGPADSPYLLVNRMDYMKAMEKACDEISIPIHFNKQVVSVDTENAAVTFKDGSTASADIIIAADGLKSVCREAVDNSSEGGIQKSGNSSDNALIPRSTLEMDDELSMLLDKVTIWVGPRAHIIFMPVRDGTVYAFATSRPDDGDRDSWSTVNDISKLRNFFKGWDPRLTRMVEHVQQGVRIGMVYRPPLHTWHKDKVVLIGDAAHAMLPFTGQGLSQGLEDADLLATLLNTHPWSDLDKVFSTLYTLRNPRTAFISSMAIRNKPLFETDVPEEMSKRDTEFAKPESAEHPLFFKNIIAREAMFGYKTEEVIKMAQQGQAQAATSA